METPAPVSATQGLVLADELGEPFGHATMLGITVGLSLVP
jgi:hypothetical protein